MSKKTLIRIIFISCIIGSIILIFINYSQIENYQISFRNNERKNELEVISQGIKRYVTDNNSCPRTSVPSPNSFLPELIIDSLNKPKGGVVLSSLENIEGYLKSDEKDPSGTPYFIGTNNNLIYIYTNDFETSTDDKSTFYLTVEASLCNQIVQ